MTAFTGCSIKAPTHKLWSCSNDHICLCWDFIQTHT